MTTRGSSFAALGHIFGVQCSDRAVAAVIDDIYGALRFTGEPDGWYVIRSVGGGLYELRWQD